MGTIEERVNELDRGVDKLSLLIEQYKTKYETLEASIKNETDRRADIEKTVYKLENKLDSLESKVNKIEENTSSLTEIKCIMEQINKTCINLTAENKSLQNKLIEMQTEMIKMSSKSDVEAGKNVKKTIFEVVKYIVLLAVGAAMAGLGLKE